MYHFSGQAWPNRANGPGSMFLTFLFLACFMHYAIAVQRTMPIEYLRATGYFSLFGFVELARVAG